jgi:hypothetical protein
MAISDSLISSRDAVLMVLSPFSDGAARCRIWLDLVC